MASESVIDEICTAVGWDQYSKYIDTKVPPFALESTVLNIGETVQSGFIPGDFGENPQVFDLLWDCEEEPIAPSIDTWVRSKLNVKTVVSF